MKKTNKPDGYLPVLDGLRAICMMLVFFFHNYQQTWLRADFRIGNLILTLEPFQRYGYIAIDAFFVLSGFCLFYPVARNMFGEAREQSIKEFYIKRLRRIIPAYYFMLILLLIFPVLSYVIYSPDRPLDLLKHFGSHALFIHIYNPSTLGSTISTAWTLGIEAAFYLFFPLLSKAFRKSPAITFGVMFITAHILRILLATQSGVGQYEAANPLLYLDVFAWGMISSYAVVYVRHKMPYFEKTKILMTVISVLCLIGVYMYMLWMGQARIEGQDAQTYHRLLYRTILAGFFALFLFAASYSAKPWQAFWGNRVFVFISSISYSFYLWHQNVHIALRKLNIPYTDANPVMDDKRAMIIFMLLSIIISFAIAIFSTYCIEKPIIKYGFKGCVLKAKNIFKKA